MLEPNPQASSFIGKWCMDEFEQTLNRLRVLVHHQREIDHFEFSKLRSISALYDFELANALLALLGHHLQAYIELSFPKLLQSGACPLYERGYFLWKKLPYWHDHAELALTLFRLADKRQCDHLYDHAKKMKRWQSQTLDHLGRPLHALYTQESTHTFEQHVQMMHKLNECVVEAEPVEEIFVDDTLGLVIQRSDNFTLFSVGSGCKSGVGGYLMKDLGIVNFGPQMLPLGNCQGFGLAGQVKDFQLKKSEQGWISSYCAALSAPNARKTPLSYLKDSALSGLWMRAENRFQKGRFEANLHFEGIAALSRFAFSFFCKAKRCVVAGSHLLSQKSLDRYKGPSQLIELRGENESIWLECFDQNMLMEVIPLAGDESFWHADFLVSFYLTDPKLSFVIHS